MTCTYMFVQAKVEHKNTDMQLEGVHGIWELAVNPDNHNDIVRIRILCLVDCLKGSDWTVVQTTCNAIWALSTSSSHRQTFGEAGVVEHLLRILKVRDCIRRLCCHHLHPGPLLDLSMYRS